MKNEECWIYVLRDSITGKLYTGISTDLKQRFQEHLRGKTAATRKTDPTPVYLEKAKSRSEAARRENFLKTGVGRNYLAKNIDNEKYARVAELVDARDLKSLGT